MDARVEFLKRIREQGLAQDHLGLLHILIGRRINLPDGTPVSNGITWRDLAALLKKVRWPKESVRELSLEAEQLPLRDRDRYWYMAIAHAGVDSPKAAQSGDALAEALRQAGFTVGPAPGKVSPPA